MIMRSDTEPSRTPRHWSDHWRQAHIPVKVHSLVSGRDSSQSGFWVGFLLASGNLTAQKRPPELSLYKGRHPRPLFDAELPSGALDVGVGSFAGLDRSSRVGVGNSQKGTFGSGNSQND
jgi:hypothetical protein